MNIETGQLILISFVWNLLKLMPCSQQFDILLMKPLSHLSILLYFIPIYLIYVLLRENSLSHLTEFAFYREMLYI